MAKKKPLFGVNNYTKRTQKKRPGRHAKRPNKSKKRTMKKETVKYNHDEVYNAHKERFESMNCFDKYKSYTNSNAMPAFCRDLQIK